jgi:hypothetical protein
MVGGKGNVIPGMPILSRHNPLKGLTQPIDNGNHLFSVGNRKVSSGAEINLHIHNQQNRIIWDFHNHLRLQQASLPFE